MKLTKQLKADIITHALDCYPAESCGVVVKTDVDTKYIPCINTATDNEQFILCPKDFARAESMGEIQAIVHSHPDGGVLPSDLDKLQIELHGLPWVIVAVSKQDYADEPAFGIYEPCGYRPPLLGRNYIHGVQDCYAIVRDFYEREFSIELLGFERTDAWWENPTHEPLYENNFKTAGFVPVDFNGLQTDHLQYGDVLLCRVGRTHHVNHALIWLGDNGTLKSETTPPCIGNTLILHHPYGRQSVREIYGRGWADGINADQIYFGATKTAKKPFIFATRPTTIDGVSYPAGAWFNSVHIANGSIDIAKINKASIQSLSALSANIGHFKSAQTGARLEIKDSVLLVYDANNVLRVRLGLW